MNLLCMSRFNPLLSSWAYIFMTIMIASPPPRLKKIMIHSKLQQRKVASFATLKDGTTAKVLNITAI